MVSVFDRSGPRPVCASCNAPVDEGRCASCRSWRPDQPSGLSPALLAALAGGLLVLWVVLLALA